VDQANAYREDDFWLNTFMCSFSLLNSSNDSIAITKVKTEYQTKDGKWEECKTRLGNRQGFYNYYWYNYNNFNMDGLQQNDLAVQASIPIHAPQYDRERRAHKSLPQPLLIRVTFEDSNSRTSVITVPHVNTPLDLVTKEKRVTNRVTCSSVDGKSHDIWVHCDDPELDVRIFGEGFFEHTQRRIELCSNERNKNKWLYVHDLKKIAFGAVKENKSEVELKELHWTHSSIPLSIQCFLLVDLEGERVYGAKYVLKTTTSSVTECFLFPKFTPEPEE